MYSFITTISEILDKKKHLILILLITFFILINISAISGQNHVLYNLEPYPDSLVYIVPAINFVHGDGLVLTSAGKSFSSWVPGLYTFTLIPIFTLFKQPQYFVLTNIILGVITLISIWHAVIQILGKSLYGHLAVLLLLMHGYFLLITTIGLSENLLITLISFSVLILTQKKISFTYLQLSGVLILLLLMTKYQLVPLVIFLTTYITFQIVTKTRSYFKYWTLILVTIFTLFCLYHLQSIDSNPFKSLSPTYETKSKTIIIFFSLAYLQDNIIHYSTTLMGKSTSMLWFNNYFTSTAVFIMTIFPLFIGKFKKTAYLLWGIQLSQLVLLLFFYVHDTRYILGLIPVMVTLAIIGIYVLHNSMRSKLISYIFTALIFITLAFIQISNYRIVIANNLLHRSQAWQYEAVLHADREIADDSNNYLITVLPPAFYDLYARHQYNLLPLSTTQEFMNQGQQLYVFDNLDNLPELYRKLLNDGKRIYVLDSYFSNSKKFELDWKYLQDNFETKVVSKGCSETCTVYELYTL